MYKLLHSPKFAHWSRMEAWKLVPERGNVTIFSKTKISMLADGASHEESSSDEDDIPSTLGAIFRKRDHLQVIVIDEALLSPCMSDSEGEKFCSFSANSDDE